MSLLPSRPEASPREDAEPRVVGVDSDDADEVLSALSSETARKLLASVHENPAPPSELADRVDTSLQNAQYHLEKLENAGAVEVVDTAYSAKGREMDVYAAADQPLVIFAGDQDDSSMLRTALTRLLGALGALAAASLGVQALVGRLDLLGGAPSGGAGGGGAPSGGAAGGGDGGGGAGGAGSADAGATPTPDGGMTTQDVGTATPQPTPGGEGDIGIATPKPPSQETPFEAITGSPTEVSDQAVQTAADVGREGAAGLPPGLLFFAGGAFVLAVVAVVWYWRR